MKTKLLGYLAIALFIAGVFACKENDQEKLRRIELERLDEYVRDNNLQDYRKPSGLYYKELAPGVGDTINPGDQVQIYYSTWALSDTIYHIDETEGYSEGYRYEPYTFVVGSGTAIDGLEEAATYMQKGTKAKLVIPSELAYGQRGSSIITGFTTVIMEVEVYKVFPAQ